MSSVSRHKQFGYLGFFASLQSRVHSLWSGADRDLGINKRKNPKQQQKTVRNMEKMGRLWETRDEHQGKGLDWENKSCFELERCNCLNRQWNSLE